MTMAADQSMEEAMIIIQEASAKIAKVSDKLSGLENNNQEVVTALKDLSNKQGVVTTIRPVLLPETAILRKF